ncbi:MAG: glycosyltransferase family 2 protein [Hyphomicrobiaceae bacterium]|nr:glycosyltransferase family 2 protein [Hyphomicrobiaceae bacterium]
MKFSVIIPSYNQGRFIGRTIDSALSQEGAALDISVFDGGSTDTTLDVLKSYGGRIFWVSEKDDGQADAVNKGIRATRGDIIAWLNSDDVYMPGALRAVSEVFQSHPEIDLVYGRGHHIDVEDAYIDDYPSEPWNFERMRDQCLFCQPATFFRRSVVERFGMLDTSLNYCMDYEFWLRVAKGGAGIYYLDKVLAGSRLYDSNKTLGARRKVHAEINDMQRRLFGEVPQRWLLNYAHVVSDETIHRTERPTAYAWSLFTETLKAGRKWNRRIEWQPLALCLRWTRAAMMRQVRRS